MDSIRLYVISHQGSRAGDQDEHCGVSRLLSGNSQTSYSVCIETRKSLSSCQRTTPPRH
jgi:hypothetical protein